ncbi:MAG: glycosyltransferase, partial [Armatimonadota bacterium]
AAGKAVVSTATMGPAGYLRQGETGLLTPVGDWVRLAEALLQLADDPALRERLGAAARRQAEEEFSLPAYRQRLLELYSLTTKG